MDSRHGSDVSMKLRKEVVEAASDVSCLKQRLVCYSDSSDACNRNSTGGMGLSSANELGASESVNIEHPDI